MGRCHPAAATAPGALPYADLRLEPPSICRPTHPAANTCAFAPRHGAVRAEGVLFGAEMATAAMAGAEAGARVLCLRDARDAPYPRVAPWLEQRLGQLACWLRARCDSRT